MLKNIWFTIERSAHHEQLLHSFSMGTFGFEISLLAHVRHLHIAFDTNHCESETYQVDESCLSILKGLEYKHAVSMRIYRPRSETPLQRRVLDTLEAISGWLSDARIMGLEVGCAMKMGSMDADFCRLIGNSIADFDEFKASWPGDVSFN
jgi:hypothetical protein